MNLAEAKFWQKFYRRTQNANLDDSPLKSLFESRFAFLNRKDESGWALRSLLAMDDSEKKKFTLDFLDRALSRFAGLEFARSHKVRAFSDISSSRTNLETASREGLIRMVFDAAYLGVSAFVLAWEKFREAFVCFRRGEKVSTAVLNLAAKLASEENLYARLRMVASSLAPEKPLPDWEEPLTLPSSKAFREAFSPYLSGRFLKDFELKNARELLSRSEKAEGDTAIFRTKVALQVLLEQFELLRFKRSMLANVPGERIEKDALLKLRDRFKGR